jgi:hypothetical protein
MIQILFHRQRSGTIGLTNKENVPLEPKIMPIEPTEMPIQGYLIFSNISEGQMDKWSFGGSHGSS